MERPAIALFARAPIPGRVKTRLIGPLSPEQACELHRALTRDCWEALESPSDVYLYTDEEHPEWRALAGPRWRQQRGSNLGERLWHCFREMQAAGHRPLLILGSDAPLTPELLAPWTGLLAASPALLGPAEDGGYWAIGCRAPHPRMFEGVEWSSPGTLAQTVTALERCGLPPAFLPSHYDIDTLQDLRRLAREPRLGVHTRRWLEGCGL